MLLIVNRSFDEHGGKGVVFIDSFAMAKAGIGTHDIIEIRSHSGRNVLAKVANPLAEDANRGTIRIDRYMREAIKVALREEVHVERIAAQPVSRVSLMPLMDISLSVQELKAHLQNTLSSDSLPVCVNSLVSASLPAPLGRATFKVVVVEPGPGILIPSTEIEIVSRVSSADEHDHELTSDVTYDDVGGVGNELKMVKELIEIPLRFPQAYSHLGITPPRGVILHGPPGVGKTHLTLAIANEVASHFFYINGPEADSLTLKCPVTIE